MDSSETFLFMISSLKSRQKPNEQKRKDKIRIKLKDVQFFMPSNREEMMNLKMSPRPKHSSKRGWLIPFAVDFLALVRKYSKKYSIILRETFVWKRASRLRYFYRY